MAIILLVCLLLCLFSVCTADSFHSLLFQYAIQGNYWGLLQCLYTNKESVFIADADQHQTLLHLASEFGHDDLVEQLLQQLLRWQEDTTRRMAQTHEYAPATVTATTAATAIWPRTARDLFQQTPLHEACANGHYAAARQLLRVPALPMLLSASYGSNQAAASLVGASRPVVVQFVQALAMSARSPNFAAHLPLHLAAIWGHHTLVSLLLREECRHFLALTAEAAASTATVTGDGSDGLTRSGLQQQQILQQLQLLLEAAPGPGRGGCFLRKRSRSSSSEVGDDDAVTGSGASASASAMGDQGDMWGREWLLDDLAVTTAATATTELRAGSSTSWHHANPALEAAQKSADDFARWRSIDVVDSEEHTALHLAIIHNHPLVVDTLLFYGANATAVDSVGWTPLHLAALKGYGHLVRRLVGHIAFRSARAQRFRRGDERSSDRDGAALQVEPDFDGLYNAINARNKYGATPLHTACMHHQMRTAALLVGLGADGRVQDQDGQTALAFVPNPDDADVLLQQMEHQRVSVVRRAVLRAAARRYFTQPDDVADGDATVDEDVDADVAGSPSMLDDVRFFAVAGGSDEAAAGDAGIATRAGSRRYAKPQHSYSEEYYDRQLQMLNKRFPVDVEGDSPWSAPSQRPDSVAVPNSTSFGSNRADAISTATSAATAAVCRAVTEELGTVRKDFARYRAAVGDLMRELAEKHHREMLALTTQQRHQEQLQQLPVHQHQQQQQQQAADADSGQQRRVGLGRDEL